MISLVDEALVQRGRSAYLLAGVLVADDRRAAVRSATRRLVPRRRRFHFHQEEDREKSAMMQLIAEVALEAHVMIVSPCAGKARESNRQLLAEMARTIARRPAVELTIESRGAHNDRFDRMSLLRERRQGRLPEDMAYVHRDPIHEPLLWPADGLAGRRCTGSRPVKDAGPGWRTCGC